MNREEAIEVYNGLINTKIKEAFEFFAPELREINEEEIRKDIIGGLMWQRDNLKSEGPHDNNLILPGFCLTVGKHIAYLEKQKERGPLTKEEEYTLHRIIEYLEDETCPSEWISLLHDIYCFPYEKQKELPFVKDVVLGYPGLYYYDGERMHFRGSPAMEEKQKELMPPVNVDPCDASWDAYYQRGLNKGYELGLEAGRKEQKPISTEDMPYITDEHFYEREPADSFKYKLAEYMTKCCTKKEGPYGYTYGISAESILKMAKEELIKRGELKEQKPVAWSEEDKKILDDVSHILIGLNYKQIAKDYKQAVEKLIYARPSWKPTDEQMEALKECGECKRCIKELYEQLKKL